MPTFQYKGLQANGTMAEGRVDAPGRPDAFRQIEARGLRPINLEEQASAKSPASAGASAGLDKFSLILFNQRLNSSTSRGLTKQAKRWDPITSSNPG